MNVVIRVGDCKHLARICEQADFFQIDEILLLWYPLPLFDTVYDPGDANDQRFWIAKKSEWVTLSNLDQCMRDEEGLTCSD